MMATWEEDGKYLYRYFVEISCSYKVLKDRWWYMWWIEHSDITSGDGDTGHLGDDYSATFIQRPGEV